MLMSTLSYYYYYYYGLLGKGFGAPTPPGARDPVTLMAPAPAREARSPPPSGAGFKECVSGYYFYGAFLAFARRDTAAFLALCYELRLLF